VLERVDDGVATAGQLKHLGFDSGHALHCRSIGGDLGALSLGALLPHALTLAFDLEAFFLLVELASLTLNAAL
jgi:hypothetical protein